MTLNYPVTSVLRGSVACFASADKIQPHGHILSLTPCRQKMSNHVQNLDKNTCLGNDGQIAEADLVGLVENGRISR